MNLRLRKLTHTLRKKGLVATHVPQGQKQYEDERVELRFPQYPDCGVDIFAIGYVFYCSVWESYAGNLLGEFWSEDIEELVLLALLKIVQFEEAA